MSSSGSSVAVEVGEDRAAAPAPRGDREFAFTDRDFEFIRGWIKERAGINLSDNKRQLVYGRLAKRLRALGLRDFKSYCKLLASEEGEKEIGTALNALTTNKTSFFRENHHFQHLAEVVLPKARSESQSRPRLRIWSAGCSSGEEPHSTAITLCESLKDLDKWDAKVLATDIDTNMVRHGREGIYRESVVESIPAHLRKRYLNRLERGGDQYRLSDEVRSLIVFKQLNLLGPWPMKGPFDLIFCRNVVIYFDKPTQRQLFDRYADMLKDDGFLYIGHSETLFKITDRFKLVGQSIYQKLR